MRYCPVCQATYPDGVPSCPRDGKPTLILSQDADPYLGKFAGSYQLTQKLGEGGMGVVYLAKHPALGKRAAVKLLQTDLKDQGRATERFFAEAQIVSQLGHENIVDVYDFGLLEGVYPYFVMEYLEGEPLSQLLARETALPPDVSIEIVIQLLDALSVAHSKNVVHRDLKPDNTFLLQRRGRYFVKLLDFGIAKLKDAASKKLTKTGILIGTPQYMSPEQVEGEVELDGRADLYSVGVLLFEMVCGRPPFTGMMMGAIAIAHTTEPPPRPRSLRPDLSPRLESVILRALEKNRDDRYSSAEEMISALQEAQQQPLLVPTDSIDTPHGVPAAPVQKPRSLTQERTGLRDNPFEEIRSGRIEESAPLPTMASPLVTPEPTQAIPVVSHNSQEGTAVSIPARPTKPAKPTYKRTPEPVGRTPDPTGAPTMATPIIPSTGPQKTMLRPSSDPLIPATMATPIVSPSQEDMPTTNVIPTDSIPTMMVEQVPPKAPSQEMPTMHTPTVTPKGSTLPDGEVTSSPQPFADSETTNNPVVPPSKKLPSIPSKEASLDAKPEDVFVAKPSENRMIIIAIVALSVLAVVLWVLAIR